VGQQATFTLNGLPMEQVTNMVGQWSLPEKYVNEQWQNFTYDQDGDEIPYGSVNYRMNNSLLVNTNQTAGWFYNSTGGKEHVGVGLNLQFSNGQRISVAAKGDFMVVKPRIVGMAHSCTGVGFSTNSNSTINVVNCDNMDFTILVKRPNYFSGEAFYTQLINRDASWDVAPEGLPAGIDTTWGNFYLDTREQYQAPVQFNFLSSSGQPSSPVHPVDLPDSPEVGGNVNSYINCQDDFNTFLRFQPDGNGSIPVTIGIVYWGWHGNAHRYVNSGGQWLDWSLISSYYGPNLNVPEDRFPIWLNTYIGTPRN
jgi:hypothetical protein